LQPEYLGPKFGADSHSNAINKAEAASIDAKTARLREMLLKQKRDQKLRELGVIGWLVIWQRPRHSSSMRIVSNDSNSFTSVAKAIFSAMVALRLQNRHRFDRLQIFNVVSLMTIAQRPGSTSP